MHPITHLALAASLVAAITSSTGSALADEDIQAWQEDAGQEPPPRYGPGGEREPERSSRGGAKLGIGIGLTVLGGVGIVGGGLLAAASAASCLVPEGGCHPMPAAGALAGGGALGLLVGIPLIVIGNRERKGIGQGETFRVHTVALPAGGTGLGLSGSF
jgi:hypothetical protein